MGVDFHSHFFPKAYLEALRGPSCPYVERNPSGQVVLHQARGMELPLDPAIFDIDKRLENGVPRIDTEVLSITVPGVERLKSKEMRLRMARLVNDELAKVVSRHPGRFAALAALPLQDVEASLDEMDRALGGLSLNGVLFFSNVNGRHLDDRRFWPLFERAERLRAPVLIHPTIPPSTIGIRKFELVESIGFMYDTTVNLCRMVYSGLLEKYRDVKIVISHLGGTLPYLMGRIDALFGSTPEVRESIPKPPSEYLKKVYYDTTTSLPQAVALGYELFGPDNLVLGSDYPIWRLDSALATVNDARIPGEAKSRILSNGKRLLINAT